MEAGAPEAAVAVKRPCARFCGKDAGWGVACTWHEDQCSGCDECSALSKDEDRPCMKFCQGAPEACAEHGQACSGCAACLM
mmetsp:Transcript_17003/g.49770  ORF Transcript_17003/g.49770 Transcript_17003/m.49770 type:complete len:81 (+) Transcript_17003:2-244(+)